MHKVIPKLILAHFGSGFPQSQQTLFPGIVSSCSHILMINFCFILRLEIKLNGSNNVFLKLDINVENYYYINNIYKTLTVSVDCQIYHNCQ